MNGNNAKAISTVHIDNIGTKTWRDSEGNLHRVDGPAIEYPHGTCFWYLHGNLHRIGGPAVIFSNGVHVWAIDDVRFLKKEEYWEALSEEEKIDCLFSNDFWNF